MLLTADKGLTKMNNIKLILADGVGTLMAIPVALGLFLLLGRLASRLNKTPRVGTGEEQPPGDPTLLKVLVIAAVIASSLGIALAVQSRNASLDAQRKVCQLPRRDNSGSDLDDCVDIRSDIGSEGAKAILVATSAFDVAMLIAWRRHRKGKLREAQRAKQARQDLHARAIKQERLASAVEDGILGRLDGAVALGGSSQGLSRGGRYSIVFSSKAVLVVPDNPSLEPLMLGYHTLAVSITGQGERTSNLGLWGGGFGVKGAAKGILAASVLNSLTTRTDIDTVIALSDATQEVYFHYDKETPENLRIRLAPVFVKLRANSAVTTESNSTLVTDLSRLVELRDSGALSEDEFAAAKERLLDQGNSSE